ncbi:MAG: NifU family protein [Candidatus Peregrinibacteria bacterium]
MSSKKRVTKGKKKHVDFTKLELDDQIKLITQVLKREVGPLLAMHGGGVEIMDIEGMDIIVEWQGACSACPIAENATLPYIEEVLRTQIDPGLNIVTL